MEGFRQRFLSYSLNEYTFDIKGVPVDQRFRLYTTKCTQHAPAADVQMKARIIFEESGTRIYQRIIHAFRDALVRAGHDVNILGADSKSLLELAEDINTQKPAFVFITNPHGFLNHYLKKREKYFYELIRSHLVFIHHDNFFGPIYDPEDIRKRFEGIRRVADNSTHFCIENSNIKDLKDLSVPNVYKIFHATEFTGDGAQNTCKYDCSFVGHVLKYSNQLENLRNRQPVHRHVADDLAKRLERLDFTIGKSAEQYADSALDKSTNIVEWMTRKQYYNGLVHNTSLFFRGKLLQDLADTHPIDIIGGTPAYIHGANIENKIDHPGLHYHAPTNDPLAVRDIYSGSKINLNITSLQFDTAIINRVMDIGGAGGFPLTDWRDDLVELSVHEQISYRTPAELSGKIDYFLTHEQERKEVALQLHNEIEARFTYTSAVKSVLDKIT